MKKFPSDAISYFQKYWTLFTLTHRWGVKIFSNTWNIIRERQLIHIQNRLLWGTSVRTPIVCSSLLLVILNLTLHGLSCSVASVHHGIATMIRTLLYTQQQLVTSVWIRLLWMIWISIVGGRILWHMLRINRSDWHATLPVQNSLGAKLRRAYKIGGSSKIRSEIDILALALRRRCMQKVWGLNRPCLENSSHHCPVWEEPGKETIALTVLMSAVDGSGTFAKY